MKNLFRTLGFGLVSASIPFFLIMTAIRMLVTPLYPQVEYRMPWFPPDSYGFSLQDRLKWSAISIEYLRNSADISFLADQRLDDGSPLYNERELSHMEDVKALLIKMNEGWLMTSLVYFILVVLAWRKAWLRSLLMSFGRGGVWTIGLIAVILGAVAVSFNGLFTALHRLFFQGNTWLFLYSDTLIRLFPIPFWRDAFILVGVFTILGALFLILLGNRARPRS